MSEEATAVTAPLTGANAEAQRLYDVDLQEGEVENTERKTELKIKELETEKESERKRNEIP